MLSSRLNTSMSGGISVSVKNASTPTTRSPLRTGSPIAVHSPASTAASWRPPPAAPAGIGLLHTGPPSCHTAPASPTPSANDSGSAPVNPDRSRPGVVHELARVMCRASSSTCQYSAHAQPSSAAAAATAADAAGRALVAWARGWASA
ncbi:hypothetical protein GCM10009558_107380 [Virgisporangium aurantiacum]